MIEECSMNSGTVFGFVLMWLAFMWSAYKIGKIDAKMEAGE